MLEGDVKRYVEAVQAGKKLSPRALGVLIDQFKKVEEERRKADKVAEALKADEIAIKTSIFAALRKNETTVAGGESYKAEMTTEDVPTVKDWAKFYDYIKENNAFEMLERRPGKAAIKERWDDGKDIPGVEKFPVDKLSVTKLKG